MRISDEIIDLVVNGKSAERVYACSKSFYLFKTYYFSDYFSYKNAKFQDDLDEDVMRLASGGLTEAAWIAFRESTKTTEGKMALAYVICYQLKRYIGYASYDKENSEAALFDVIVELQTNKKIIADFGHLYTERRERDESKMKRISSFITSNKIKVEAFSTQESTRGRVYSKYRPDLFILDDIETSKTRESVPITRKIIRFIRELKSGMGNGWSILYLGNYISEVGVIAYVKSRVEKNPKGVYRDIPVMSYNPSTRKYDIAWPDKYVMTDSEASIANRRIENPAEHKVSIETKQRDLDNFNEEMMNDPASSGLPFFDRKKVDEAIKCCPDPVEVLAGMSVWERFDPKCRYAGGADTSMGVGKDSNASAFFNFSPRPARQVASFESNLIGPDSFAYELKREGDIFGTCLLAPETNAKSGGTCINQLRQIYPVEKIYRAFEDGKVRKKRGKWIGWETNSATKPEAFHQFKYSFEHGEFTISDVRILREMRTYTFSDLDEQYRDQSDDAEEGTTRHFDLLMAAVIAWAMRADAMVSTTAEQDERIRSSREYRQQEWPMAGKKVSSDMLPQEDVVPGRVSKFPQRSNL